MVMLFLFFSLASNSTETIRIIQFGLSLREFIGTHFSSIYINNTD